MEYNNTSEIMASKLTRRWESFCEDNRLPLMSADELLIEFGDTLPAEMRRQVEDFIQTWEFWV